MNYELNKIPKWDINAIPLWYNKIKYTIQYRQICINLRLIFGGNAMRLKELRKAKNMTQQRLAIELGMNQNTISRYENGEREADYRTLIVFADYFGVSIDYLLGRTDDPTFLRKASPDRSGTL